MIRTMRTILRVNGRMESTSDMKPCIDSPMESKSLGDGESSKELGMENRVMENRRFVMRQCIIIA